MMLRLFLSAICLTISAQAGFIEICKDSFPIGSVAGLYSFTVAGSATVYTTPAGACTPAFTLPDGVATIVEIRLPASLFFSAATFPANRLISFNAATATAVVQIVPGDISTQTVLTVTNTPAVVPEPGTAWLLGGSGVAFWALRRKLAKRSRSAATPATD